MSRLKSLLLAAGAAAALAACAPTVARHGFQVTDADPRDVRVGEDNKTTVLSRLGSPSATSTFEPNVWYYVSQTSERYTFHKSQVSSRDVIAIAFDDASEQVTEVRVLGLEDGRQLAYNDRETPTRGRELTVIEQILGNVGRTPVPTTDEERVPGGRRRDD